jgi:lipopolysaccharide assembly outer membrane protein LptD (OstA)
MPIDAEPDSVVVDSLPPIDTLSIASHAALTTATAAAPASKGRVRRQKVDLDHPVVFTSKDSMLMVGRDSTFMYGSAQVTYGDVDLQAQAIEMDLKRSNVYAHGMPDSIGQLKGTPKFSSGGDAYNSETMSYNFHSERGYITNVVTQQGEGYLTGGQSKKMENGEFYIQNGMYTTCDQHDSPHFHFQITKGKIKPNSNIVTGPAYMVLAGLPLPIAVPFGYFPFTKKYSSGVIFPTFGDDYKRGFYLDNGGYYFAINDNVDLALTGQIYTKGSWGLTGKSSYVKRYKYSGNVSVSYLKTISGEKGDADYATATNFQVIWTHTQDSKANPNMTFSASVNFATSGYSRNDVNSYYTSALTENTKSSTVNMTYRIPNSKWTLSTTANISQRSSDGTLTVSFPNITASMSQIAPFKRKHAVGAERWYEKIKLSYSGQFQNSLTANQNEFFKKSLIKDWRNGMKHSVPISATFQVMKYFNVTPSLSITDRMYTSKVRREWDPNQSAEVADTTYGFYNVWDFSASLSFSTKVYGFFQPLPFLGNKVRMIRHVFTPTVSFSGAPDFSSSFFGYYGTYNYTDAQGQIQRKKYSMFPNTLYGVPSQGRSGVVSVSLANNLEMKLRSDNDSVPDKKVSLIENLTLSQSYNFAADSLNWSNINSSILLRLAKNFNLNLSATWDVYTYKLNQYGNPYRCNVTRLQAGKGLGRLSSTGTSFSYTFNNSTFTKLFGKNKKDAKDADGKPTKRKKADSEGDGEFDADGYMHWSFPWSLSVNYSVNYSYGTFNTEKLEYNGKVTQNLSFSGNFQPTKEWNMSFSTSYNFDQHKISYMNCNISRDLHCFTMTASFVPFGPYKSYNFHIAIKSSLLSDLKYDKRSSVSNGVDWY